MPEPASDWRMAYSGPTAEVWILAKCDEEMQKFKDKDRSKILACMADMYCQLEPNLVPELRLNRNEGRHKVGHKEYRVQAFKWHQGRVYGVQGSVKERRAFFATCAAVKKTDQADQSELRRTVERLVASALPSWKV